MNIPNPIALNSCPKVWTRDLDKAASPRQTIDMVLEKLAKIDLDIVSATRRIDCGRLGIPVYMGICGTDARGIMPTRKQMGKGSSVEQAEASAIMELMERFAFFSFWQNLPGAVAATWSEAEKLFGDSLISVHEMLLSVHDTLSESDAREVLNLVKWQFYPATCLNNGKIVWLPLDWFRMLGEFNGSSAGNTTEESLLQGLCELVERHVSCLVARQRPILPTIIPQSCTDSVLSGLIAAFAKNNIILVLKDISMGLPVPTVAALAWDPATFPQKSEIVFTAGTAASPVKAAIRAITEVAQLGGDFCTGSCYEASGLPKFSNLEECSWLRDGPAVGIESLPTLENTDIRNELMAAVAALEPLQVYAIETTNPLLDIPAHYCIAPGLEFLERDNNSSLGMFIGRKLAEETPPQDAAHGLSILARICPNAHYLPFFQGLLALRQGSPEAAFNFFNEAIPIQPDADATAMCSFYAGYAKTLENDWHEALPLLRKAAELNPQMKEYANLLGVALFKAKKYAEAESWFEKALGIDRGSAMDLANRGLCRKFQGKNELAREDLLAAIELDPSLEFAKKHLQELEASK